MKRIFLNSSRVWVSKKIPKSGLGQVRILPFKNTTQPDPHIYTYKYINIKNIYSLQKKPYISSFLFARHPLFTNFSHSAQFDYFYTPRPRVHSSHSLSPTTTSHRYHSFSHNYTRRISLIWGLMMTLATFATLSGISLIWGLMNLGLTVLFFVYGH